MAAGDTLFFWDAASGKPHVTVPATLDVRKGHVVLDFDDTNDQATWFVGVLPQNYGGGDFLIVLKWTSSTADGGNTNWLTGIERHSPTYDLEGFNFFGMVTIAAGSPSNEGELETDSGTLTATAASDPLAGETFRLFIQRFASNPTDTMLGDAELIAVELREA